MPILIDKDLSAFPGDEKKNIVQHFTFWTGTLAFNFGKTVAPPYITSDSWIS